LEEEIKKGKSSIKVPKVKEKTLKRNSNETVLGYGL